MAIKKPPYPLFKISLVLLLCITFCTGCWDRRELSDLAIVSGVGLDLPVSGQGVTLIAQIIEPEMVRSPQQSGSSGGGSSNSDKAYWNINSTGETIFEALRECTHKSPFPTFWAHSQVLIIGKELARLGFKDYLDFFVRDYEISPNITLIVVEGKAEELLNLNTRLLKNPSFNLDRSLTHVHETTSHGFKVTIADITSMLAAQSRAPVAPLVKLVNEDQEPYFVLTEMAVFNREMQVTGKLSKEETRGLLWVLGEVEGGIIVLESPNGKGKASMEILDTKSEVKPFIENGQMGVHVSIFLESSLGENWAMADEMKESDRALIEQQQAEAVEKEIRMTLQQARELNADIFGFGDLFYRYYPRQWQEIKPAWDDIFRTLEIVVDVDSNMITTPMIGQSISNIN